MAVTKRVRFEVLRRDDHACRYCGATAPGVKLTVDHVTPVALGGTDDPSNLVAACQPCNAGKSSTALDSETVADIREDALRHAELTRQAYAILVEQLGEKGAYCDEFLAAWEDQYIAVTWEEGIGRFHEMGVPIELLLDASRTAHARTYVKPGVDRFKYFCGIVWKQVSAVAAEVSIKQSLNGAWLTDEDLSEERIHAYEQGYTAGRRAVWAEVEKRYSGPVVGERSLRQVTDGPSPWTSKFNTFRDEAVEGIVWSEAS